jgi:DNA-binding transcriptional ArsR family regulator
MTRHDRPEGAGLARLAGLLADGTRATFCVALLDGRAWTAAELAGHAGVAPSTATEHLNLLVAGGLLTQERQGRHRYLRLADPETAELIESLAARVPPPAAARRGLSAACRDQALARGRTCYDHLAGELGVAITDAMTGQGLLSWSRGLVLTDRGTAWLDGLGITLPAARRRAPVRSCLDWTQRRPHLAGAAGAAVCRHAFEAGWVTRVGTGRAVAVTGAGQDELRRHLGLEPG